MNAFDVRPLVTAQFWFAVNPPPLLPFFEKAFFVVYLVALVGAIVLGFFERKATDPLRRTLLEKFRRKETTFGILGLLVAFFSYERTPFLSMRFFTLLLWGGFLFWSAVIVFWRLRSAPVIAQSANARKQFEKYLPR